jgi:hypothetical protein
MILSGAVGQSIYIHYNNMFCLSSFGRSGTECLALFGAPGQSV